jgi:hypothetical protein
MDDISIYQTDSGALEVTTAKGHRLATSGTDEPTVRTRPFCHRQAPPQHLCRGRTGAKFSMCKICPYCRRRQNLPSGTFQPRRHHLRRLPGQIPARHPLPPMGHPPAARTPHPRLHPQPPAAGKQRRRTGSRPATGAQGRPQSPELQADTGRGLIDIVTRYAQHLPAAATL